MDQPAVLQATKETRMYDSTNGAAMAAKRVKREFDITRSHAQELVARAAGYQDWHHLTRVADTADATTAEADPARVSEYLQDQGFAGVEAQNVMDIARVRQPVYFLSHFPRDKEFYRDEDIRPFLERDIERFAIAVKGVNGLLSYDECDPKTQDDEERDRSVHLMEIRGYGPVTGAEDMTPTGHLMATSEYYASTYWSLIPSSTDMASASFAVHGTPDRTRDPASVVRTWKRVSEEAVDVLPDSIAQEYARICKRVADELKDHLPRGRRYHIRIDALHDLSVEVVSEGYIGHSLDEIYDGYQIKPGYAARALHDLPRAFRIDERFTNKHRLFPIEGLTYDDSMADATLYYIDGEEMAFEDSHSYSLQPMSERIEVIGTSESGPPAGSPLISRRDLMRAERGNTEEPTRH